MDKLPIADDTSPRRCGSCTVCCVALPVPEGHLEMGSKPAGVPCTNLDSAGCRKYGTRPTACRNFFCAWLADRSWPGAWRPDRSGLLCLREELESGLVGAAVYEVRPDALDSPESQAILQALYATTTIVVVIDTNRQCQSFAHLADAPAKGPGRVAA